MSENALYIDDCVRAGANHVISPRYVSYHFEFFLSSLIEYKLVRYQLENFHRTSSTQFDTYHDRIFSI
jgi:hypothetical protein